MKTGDLELVQQQMMTLTATLGGMKLDEYIAKMQFALADGPAIDPLVWGKGERTLRAELEMAKATRRWRSELHNIAQKLIPAGGELGGRT